MKQRRPANMTEIYALRADTIDYFFPDRTKEIEFWAELAEDYGDDILHLMCGTGEVAVGLAKKGYTVTGVDLTKSMIYRARKRAEKEGVSEDMNIVEGDARNYHLNKKFDFIFISTGDFHHFQDKEDIISVLAESYAHLKPGGALGIELFKMPDKDFKRPEKKFRPLREPPEGMIVWKRNSTSYHSKNHMLEIKERLHVREGDEVTKGEYVIQLRLFTENEIGGYLSKAGFDNIKKYNTDSPYLEESSTWVVVANR